jgi:serine/threonine-protein kinase
MLDWFRVEALLGEGGMGAVYRAYDTRLDRRVALKVISLGKGTDAASRDAAKARLFREARAAAAITHPHAVATHHVGESGDQPYIVMELVEGTSLRQAIRSDASTATRLRWLAEVADALAAAHALGIVHRDVKPDNVMVTADGRVKVLDFGIARRTSGPVDASAPTTGDALATLTAKGVIVGTPAYMAPEQIRGAEVDARTDQFAWGVMAYEVLAGELPWGTPTDALALAAAILERTPVSLAARRTDAPAHAIVAIERALSREPKDRHASMAALVAALREGSVAQDSPARRHETPLAHAKTEALTTPAPATATKEKGSTRARPVMVAAVVLALFLGGALLFRARRETSQVSTSSSTSASAAPAPVSTVAAACDEVESAMESYRRRSLLRAILHMEKALALDPSLALARARLVAWHVNPAFSTGSSSIDRGRTLFAEARRELDRLDPRMRAYLLAHEPLVREPQDQKAFLTAVKALADDYPNDAEVAFLLGTAERLVDDGVASKAAYKRAIELDPTFAPPYRDSCTEPPTKEGRERELACVEACLATAPLSGACHSMQIEMLGRLGRCSDLERAARMWAAADPEHSGGPTALAGALFSEEKPPEAVAEAIRAAMKREPPGLRPRAELERDLAIVSGDFDGAIAQIRSLGLTFEDAGQKLDNAWAAAALLEESGRIDEARAELETTARASAAWSQTPFVAAILARATLRLAHIDRQSGRLSASAYARAREPLLARLRAETALPPGAPAMLVGTAERPFDPDEAKQYLAMFNDEAPDPALDVLRGEALLATGDVKAAAMLKRAESSCAPLNEAAFGIQAVLALGRSLELEGSVDAARAKYELVLSYWGHAKPRSMTADGAKKALARLASSPPTK